MIDDLFYTGKYKSLFLEIAINLISPYPFFVNVTILNVWFVPNTLNIDVIPIEINHVLLSIQILL